MTAGRKTSTNAGVAPRVFISYARSDGEQFAAQLRHRLEAKHIPLWQDRIGMEGGRDWWQQITQALDVVEFMLLVMTPAAMLSEKPTHHHVDIGDSYPLDEKPCTTHHCRVI